MTMFKRLAFISLAVAISANRLGQQAGAQS